MSFISDTSSKYKNLNVAEKLIAVNIAVFVFIYVIKGITWLLQISSINVIDWFILSKDFGELLYKPWTLITYAFFHASIWHILSNMLILYYASQYFLNYFSAKRLLNYFFLGAISGGLLFMVSYNVFPAFQGAGRSTLLGASAGVMAVLVGIATHIPNMRMQLMLIGSIKFWWIAAFLVIIDIVMLTVDNSGGHLAHIGGALLGYIYTKQLAKGKDIGKGFERLVDWFVNLFKSTPKTKRSPLKTVHKSKTSSPKTTARPKEKDDQQKKIDAILDKISKSGYDSLTKAEKDYLFNAGK